MKKLARKGLALGLSFLMFASTAYSDLSLIAHAEEEHHVWTKVNLDEILSSDSIAITMTTSDGKTYVLPNANNTSSAPKAILATVDGNNLIVTDGADDDFAWKVTKNTVEKTVVKNKENNTEAPEQEKQTVSTTDIKTEEPKTAEPKTEEPKTEESKTEEPKSEEPKSEEPKVEESSKVITEVYYVFSNNAGESVYTNASNNGIRVGNPKNADTKNWTLTDFGYLAAKDSGGTERFLGIYNNQDWRGYTLSNGAIHNNIKNQTLAFYKLTDKVAGEAPAALAAPTASLKDNTTVDFGAQVELTCATKDAKIYYNVNGSEDNYSLYEEPIEITRDTTIYAKARLDETESEVVSFHYTLAEGTKITDVTKLSAEQEFVLVFGDNKVLSTTVAGKKLSGLDVKLNDEKHLINEVNDAAIAKLKLIKTETEGQYYITSDARYLTTSATGGSLAFVDEKDDYSAWSVETEEDGNFLIKNTKALYVDKSDNQKPQYIEFYGGSFTAYSYLAGKDKKDPFVLSAYTYPEFSEPVPVEEKNTLGKLMTREFYDGDKVVVYYPGAKKLMTAESNNGKFAAVDATPVDNQLETKDLNALVFTTSVDENGQYTLKTEDGKFLTATIEKKTDASGKEKTYCGLALNDTASKDSLWTLKTVGDINAGVFNLVNANAKNGSYQLALEYYSGFTTYGIGEVKPEFKFSFYVLEEGTKVTNHKYAEDKFTIAKWAGNAHYDEVESSKKYINGDLYESNDMLDKDAKFTVNVNGATVQPWVSSKSSNTGSTNYYMVGTGLVKNTDYMQFELSTLGYGNTKLEYRMRATNTAPGALQMQYSTDGETFKNLKSGTYSYKYTAYKPSDKVDENGKAIQEPFEVVGSGDITDGVAKTSLAPTYYITFTFDIPNAAANAEKLYVRFVPASELSAKGDKAPGTAGTLRVDSVKFTANPVISKEICSFVKANPTSGEVAIGEKIQLTSDTEGAEIFYSVNGEDYKKYDAENKVELNKLPATISAYATKEGLSKSITVRYQFTQAQVAAVKAAPNGGAVFEGQRITLKSKTEGAKIFYRYRTEEEIAKDDNSEAAETERDDWIEYTGSFELKELPAQLQVKATKEGYLDSVVSTLKFTKKLNEKYNIYYGQIHAHTNISDGAGSLEDALKHASNVDNLDYIVITDHSNSIDNEKESKISENVDKSETNEWTYAHNLVKKYSTDEFTCAYGYEMTWSNGLGHMNTYNTPGFQSRTQTAYSTYGTALENYYAALRTVPDSISQFNHPGTTFGDFQDFAYYSEENDALITMIEVGNGEGAIGSSGYFPSYEYYTRALDKGWHVAPTNNQDNHKGKWGDANTARTVMLADTNDENAIYDAMRNYRIYATEDNDLSIYYTLDGNIMGTILEKDAVGDTVELKADIKDPTDKKIGKVEVVVNGGQVIDSKVVDTNEATVVFNVPAKYSYYYLKITESDKDIAVTAPVWVGEVEACGINKTYTNTVLPVAGEKLDVNVDFYNNEKAELTIDDIDIQLSDVDSKKTPVVHATGEEAGLTSVASNSTATYNTEFVYDGAGKVTYEVTVHATLNGVAKTYIDKLTVNYTVPAMVGDVIIDGTHGNDYVAGYYGGNAGEFVKLCASKNIRATVVKDKITKETLKNAKMLVVSAPAKKSGTAGAGDYTVAHFSDEFIATVKDYVADGGTVVVCGLADYADSTDCQTATEQNKLLETIGATIRMGSDEVVDDNNNGGQVYRMYPTNFNLDSDLLAGVRDGQKYSQYSGCSVDISKAVENDVVDAAEWLVRGYDTTYSVDCKDAKGNAIGEALPNGVKGVKNDNDGKVTFIARQKTKAGGQILVSGGVFLSDFEVKAEMDNADSLPYTNYTIVNNLLEGSRVQLPTTSIAEARKGEMNEIFAVEGYVTSGTDNENTTFFDTIYIQDETGGMDIFPYATPGLKIGTKMRIVGFLAQYQGDIELKVLSATEIKDDTYVWQPKEVDTKTAMDYENLGGQLLKTKGIVTKVTFNADGTVEEFWIKDKTGEEAAIFIDGYIRSATTGKNTVGEFVKAGAEVSAVGVLYKHPEGSSDVSVPVFRVRNCDEIELIKAAPEVKPQPSQPSFVERVVSGIVNTVRNIVKAIEESPVAQAIRNLFGFGNNNAAGRNTRRAAAVVAEPAPTETVEETPAVEEPETVVENPTEETVADEETPLAAPAEEKSFPVAPVAAGSVIILAGAAVAVTKATAVGAATAAASGKTAGLLAKIISLFRK